MRVFWRASLLSIASTLLTLSSAWAAERITLSYGLLERSISTESLEVYAKEGRLTGDLQDYTRYLDSEQLQQLRQLLQARATLSPVAVSQFLYTDQGEILLNRLGEVVRTESNLSGFYAMRSALIQAAGEPDGLTVINALEKFPIETVRIDLSRALNLFSGLETLIRQTQGAIGLIQQQADLEAQAISSAEFAALPDLRSPGSFTWEQYTIQLRDRRRDRVFPADIYLPLAQGQPVSSAPVIVISHGLGSNRNSYTYLAQQLASYGFAVAVPEHPGSNAEQLQALVSGRANQVTEPEEFIDRPLDIKFLLDVLERRSRNDPRFAGRLNLQQVGVVGQSLGGYTALALAGATINEQQLESGCDALNDTFNLSLLLQCRALQLPEPLPVLKDDRVKSIIAINPIGGSLFGETSFANISIPVLMVSGGGDTVAPALPEQLQPFTWLQTPDKYLLLLSQGTHFSTIAAPAPEEEAVPLPPEVVGPAPLLAQLYLKAIGVAFFKTYVANESGYQPYLSASYARLLSQSPLPVSLVRSLTASQLARIYERRPAESAVPVAPNTWTGQQP